MRAFTQELQLGASVQLVGLPEISSNIPGFEVEEAMTIVFFWLVVGILFVTIVGLVPHWDKENWAIS